EEPFGYGSPAPRGAPRSWTALHDRRLFSPAVARENRAVSRARRGHRMCKAFAADGGEERTHMRRSLSILMLSGTVTLGVSGCGGAGPARLEKQVEYDFTVADDRAKWREFNM